MENQRKLTKLCLIGILLTSILTFIQVLTTTTSAGSLPFFPQQDTPPTPFLHPPYYGTAYVTSVFDHGYPRYSYETDIVTTSNTYVVHNNGIKYGQTITDVHVVHCQELTPHCYTGHNGIDYGVPTGEPILAAGDGSVTFANWGDNNHLDDGYGLSVVISHTDTNGYYTQYSHLSSASVDGKKSVQAGAEASYLVWLSSK